MQQQQGRLRGDRQADLVAHEQSRGSLEMLFLEQHAHVAEELLLIVGGETREDRNARLDHASPVLLKWLGAEALAPSSLAREDHARKLLVRSRNASGAGAA